MLEFFTVLGKWFPAKIAAFRVQIAAFAFGGSLLEFFTVLGKWFPAKMDQNCCFPLLKFFLYRWLNSQPIGGFYGPMTPIYGNAYWVAKLPIGLLNPVSL